MSDHRVDNLHDNPDAAHHAEDVIQVQPKKNWKSYIWDTLDKSPEERRFLFKLDSAVLTFATLGEYDEMNDVALYRLKSEYSLDCLRLVSLSSTVAHCTSTLANTV